MQPLFGSRPLHQICSDRIVESLQGYDDPADTILDIDWPLQRKLINSLFRKVAELEEKNAELEKKNTEHEEAARDAKAYLPLADFEAAQGCYDANYDYIGTHGKEYPDAILEKSALDRSTARAVWRDMVRLADSSNYELNFEQEGTYKPSDYLKIVRNGPDSVYRFSLCNALECKGKHQRHYELLQLISFDLLRKRLKNLSNETEFDYDRLEFDQGWLWWSGAGLAIEYTPMYEKLNLTRYCYRSKDVDSTPIPEVFINAILSPLGDKRRGGDPKARYYFAKRYLRLFD